MMESPTRTRVGSDTSIDTWRLSVPSRLERRDPFEDEQDDEDSEFPLRASTRLVSAFGSYTS